jgi:hypothetical protein
MPPAAQEAIDNLFGHQAPRHNPIPGEIYLPQFNTTAEYRQASRLLMAEWQKLDNVRARTDAALAHESFAPRRGTSD